MKAQFELTGYPSRITVRLTPTITEERLLLALFVQQQGLLVMNSSTMSEVPGAEDALLVVNTPPGSR